ALLAPVLLVRVRLRGAVAGGPRLLGVGLTGCRGPRQAVLVVAGGRCGGEAGQVLVVALAAHGAARGLGGVLGGHMGAELVDGTVTGERETAAPDGVEGLAEDGRESAEFGVDVVVGAAAQRLGVGAALGGVLVRVAVLVQARTVSEELLTAA